MNASILCCRMGVLFYLVTIAGVSGQIATSSQPVQQASPNQITLQAFQTEQQTLAKSFNALLTLSPTQQQLQAWQQQNAIALANQQQLALNMAAESALEPQPLPGAPNIPANASSTLRDLLTTQAALANARAQIHNQLLNALPLEVSDAQLSQMQQSEEQLFQQQQGANLQLQAQRAQILANESAQQPMPIPPPLSIPPGSNPQMTAFLTAWDQLMRDQITFSNQYVTATSAVRDAALQQWQKQSATRFQQLQQLGQNLSPTSSN